MSISYQRSHKFLKTLSKKELLSIVDYHNDHFTIKSPSTKNRTQLIEALLSFEKLIRPHLRDLEAGNKDIVKKQPKKRANVLPQPITKYEKDIKDTEPNYEIQKLKREIEKIKKDKILEDLERELEEVKKMPSSLNKLMLMNELNDKIYNTLKT